MLRIRTPSFSNSATVFRMRRVSRPRRSRSVDQKLIEFAEPGIGQDLACFRTLLQRHCPRDPVVGINPVGVEAVKGATKSKMLCIVGKIEPLVMPAVDQRTDEFSVPTNEVHLGEIHERTRD
jgi:hypothetical protein